jgi:NAD(P)-dependent dehydrogenase (short-subunit alcohol dehydrogenase family)
MVMSNIRMKKQNETPTEKIDNEQKIGDLTMSNFKMNQEIVNQQGHLLKDKVALIYGATGAVGSTVAQAFAREGAQVFLSGRHLSGVQNIAKEISSYGGIAEAAQVDALDEESVEKYVQEIFEKMGQIDISFNAIGIPHEEAQGILLNELSVEGFIMPIVTYAKSHFITSRAAARRMVRKGSGVILMHTPQAGVLGIPRVGGVSSAWAAMEALSRNLSAELATQGIRAICLRTTGLPETKTIEVVFGIHAKAMGITSNEFQQRTESMAHTKRSTTLAELASAAVFAASDLSRGMTGAVINLTGGIIVD